MKSDARRAIMQWRRLPDRYDPAVALFHAYVC